MERLLLLDGNGLIYRGYFALIEQPTWFNIIYIILCLGALGIINTFGWQRDAPIYFGFGSNRAPQDLNQVMIQSARALGRRAIVSRGWADLSLMDDAHDCIAIGEVNQQALFKRVSAVVHHGGAGTTTTAAGAGAPQVVIPQHYDQHYFAKRVQQLGVGVSHVTSTPTSDSLTNALERILHPDVAIRARSVASAMRGDGAQVAARRLTSMAYIGKTATA